MADFASHGDGGSVWLDIQLGQAAERQGGRRIVRRRELDAVGGAGPIREGIDHPAVRTVSDDLLAAFDVMRRVDRGECLKAHEDHSLLADGDAECIQESSIWT